MPIKLLNYMATGRAIVSFEGSAEVLQHEITGLVVPKNDIGAFSNAILRLLDSPDLVKKLGTAAQLTTQQFFVWEKSINLLESIYLSLLDKAR
jgi:glycosyltransferase involved in cell wall biosynthesis